MLKSASFSKTCKRSGAALCFLSTALLTGCRAGDADSEHTQPEMRFETVHFQSYRGPTLTAVGDVGSLVYRREVGDLSAREVTATFPQEGAGDVRFSAPVLVGDVPSRSYEASGGVRMETGADSARTERARYAESDGLVRGDRPIEVYGPGYTLKGPSFTLDPRLGELDVRGGVRLVASGEGRRP